MARIRNFDLVPPGGWRFVEPTTGVRFHTDNWGDLLRAVNRHREYKGISTENTQIEIERQLCTGLSTEHCRPEPGENYRPVDDLTQRLTTEMAVAANKAILEIAKRALVGENVWNDPAEAKERADVCRNCPFNKPAKDCSCHAVYKAVNILIPRAREQPGMGVCMACGCSLQAKVNLPGEVIRASQQPGVVYPEWCWQKKFAESIETDSNR